MRIAANQGPVGWVDLLRTLRTNCDSPVKVLNYPPFPRLESGLDSVPRTPHCAMTHVVTESCIRCKYTDCVDVCPVDCFREGPNMLVIDPDECIDCAVCIPECPVNAIKAEEDLDPNERKFIALNLELARDWPSITRTKPSLPDADEWKDVPDKLTQLAR